VLGVSKDSVNKALKTFFEGLDKVVDHRSGGHARCATHSRRVSRGETRT
jgi:hypothetical protein